MHLHFLDLYFSNYYRGRESDRSRDRERDRSRSKSRDRDRRHRDRDDKKYKRFVYCVFFFKM